MEQNLTIYLLVLFVAVVIISQTVMVSVAGNNAKKNRLLKKRLETLGEEDQKKATSIVRKHYLESLPGWERALESTQLATWLGAKLESAGMQIKAYRFILLLVTLCIMSSLLLWFTHKDLPLCIGAPVMILLMFAWVVHTKTINRLSLFEAQLVDALDVLKRALQVGYPFSEALKTVAEELPDPIASEFRRTYAEINYGVDLKIALSDLASRNPTLSMLAFVSAVVIQKETGGNMSENLEKLAQVIRGRFRLFAKVKSLSAEGRMSAWILGLIPLGMFLMLYVSNPDYLAPLTDSPRGIQLLWLAGGAMFIGLQWIRRILKVEV